MDNQDGPGGKDNRGSQYAERESNKRGQRWGKKVKEMAPELPWFLMTFQFQSLRMPGLHNSCPDFHDMTMINLFPLLFLNTQF